MIVILSLGSTALILPLHLPLILPLSLHHLLFHLMSWGCEFSTASQGFCGRSETAEQTEAVLEHCSTIAAHN